MLEETVEPLQDTLFQGFSYCFQQYSALAHRAKQGVFLLRAKTITCNYKKSPDTKIKIQGDQKVLLTKILKFY